MKSFFTTALTGAILMGPAAFALPADTSSSESGSGAASGASAAVTDLDILQFALTLENIENAFYKQALNKFSSSDFESAGCPSNYYTDLQYIAHDEASHVQLLTQAISAAGGNPVKPCTYQFNLTDAKSFITLSSVLEGVGTSAYLGGAPLIQSKGYLTVAGSILVTEALHTSLQRYQVGEVPFANPYGTPLGANEVYSLAVSFIKSCPPSNPTLPFKAFPALAATNAGQVCTAGQSVCFVKPKGAIPAKPFITFLSGLSVVSVPARQNGNGNLCAIVPTEAQGQTYALLTKSAVTTVTDDKVIAGPAILEITPPAPTS